MHYVKNGSEMDYKANLNPKFDLNLNCLSTELKFYHITQMTLKKQHSVEQQKFKSQL